MQRRTFTAGFLLLLSAGCGGKKASPPSENDIKEFFAAVEDGDAEIVRRLLQAKPAMASVKNEAGRTALEAAAARGNDEMVSVLRKAAGSSRP
jgi:ankyrin repeat protein